MHFTDLIQEAAATYEKNLRVGSKQTTLGVGLRNIEEMYVFDINLC